MPKSKKNKKTTEEKAEPKKIYTSFIDDDVMFYEQVCNPDKTESRYVYWDHDKKEFCYIPYMKGREGDRDLLYIPIHDDAITEDAVLLPSEPEDYGKLEDLVWEIREHIHTYLDISENYELFATYYVLLSWVYDRVNTLPYLRALGDTGTGKSRFLSVIGRLCYKACMVAGSITPAPIYRMIKRWHGTIILDEADFKISDEQQQIIKILNCGFEKGIPVIRCKGEHFNELDFLPTYCPKVLATRFTYKDKALESRCLTERMTQTSRENIPVLLPKSFYEAQANLRNKLLKFRFDYYYKIDSETAQKIKLGKIEPRIRQATNSFAVLFANIPELAAKFESFLTKYNQELVEERAVTFEGMIVNSLFELHNNNEQDTITSKDVADKMTTSYDLDKVTPQKIGKYLKSLGIKTKQQRVDGVVMRIIEWNDKLMANLNKRYVVPSNTPLPHSNGTLVTLGTNPV